MVETTDDIYFLNNFLNISMIFKKVLFNDFDSMLLSSLWSLTLIVEPTYQTPFGPVNWGQAILFRGRYFGMRCPTTFRGWTRKRPASPSSLPPDFETFLRGYFLNLSIFSEKKIFLFKNNFLRSSANIKPVWLKYFGLSDFDMWYTQNTLSLSLSLAHTHTHTHTQNLACSSRNLVKQFLIAFGNYLNHIQLLFLMG